MLKMIDIQNETLIPFKDLPGWCEQNLGRRISPSTLHRWRLRGCRGIKLETLLIGGARTTSDAALQRFFLEITRIQDGEPQVRRTPCRTAKVSHESDAAFLKSQGI